MKLTRCIVTAIAVCVIAAAFASDADCAVRYTVVDLGTLGGSTSAARDINSDGEIVGLSHITGDSTQHGFFWDPTTEEMADLGTLPAPRDQISAAYAMNDAGWAVGQSGTPGTVERHAILWGPEGEIVDLDTLGGPFSYAYGINSSLQVVGGSRLKGQNTAHAFLWEDGKMTALGTLGGDESYAKMINDRGQVAGTSRFQMGSDLVYAFLWEDGEMRELPTLGGSQSKTGGMNGHGVVVGTSNPPGDSVECAFVWDPENGMRELPGLGGSYTGGTDINHNGVIVGFAHTSDGSRHACIWYSEDEILDLNELIPPDCGWELDLAHAINDDGKIVGSGFHNGQGKAFLLNPIATNEPPVAVIYVSSSVPAVGDTVDLDGSGSNDPDEDDLTYSWSVSDPDGAAVPVTNPTLVGASFVADLPGEYVVSLVVNDGTVDSAPDTVIVAALTSQQAVQEVVDVLSDIVDSNPGTPLADKVEDVIDKLLTVIDELNKPDNQAAIGNIEGAVGDLEAAISDDLLDSVLGTQLMDDLAAIARRLANNALNQAIAQGGDPDAIQEAELSLLEGDELRADEEFKDAVGKYKDALANAEGAL